MRRSLPGAWLAAGCALAAASHAEPGKAWSGPGWYQVFSMQAGRRIEAGPYESELACKKAMNSSGPARACVELRKAPA